MLRAALTIAGSDPSGGAGIQADLKTFHQFGVYGQAVVTLITVQNTMTVERVECLPADLVAQQIGAVLADIRPAAAKTGALGNRALVEAVALAAEAFDFPLVVDPVMISKHGVPLIAEESRLIVRRHLIPRAFLLTPNLNEAEALAGFEVRSIESMRRAAVRLCEMGAKAVLVKGGHLSGCATDVFFDGRRFREFRAARVETKHTHGTGCTYSAAIAAGLALGRTLEESVTAAKLFIDAAIRGNPGLGRGSGPVNHWAEVEYSEAGESFA